MGAELRAIALALEWANGRGIDLDARIESTRLLTHGEVTSLSDALRVNHRPRDPQNLVVEPLVHHSRCLYVRDYLKWRSSSVIARIDREGGYIEAVHRLDVFLKQFTGSLSKPTGAGREGLPPDVEARLREVIVPGHAANLSIGVQI
jgi:hypothetical protein